MEALGGWGSIVEDHRWRRLIHFAAGSLVALTVTGMVVAAGDRLWLWPELVNRRPTIYLIVVFAALLGFAVALYPKPMFERLVRFAAGYFVAFIAPRIVIEASEHLGFWLGRENQGLVSYLTVPFAVLLGLAAALWPRGWQAWFAVLVGGILGLLYALMVNRFILPGFRALIVQEVSCWVGGGICAVLAVAIGVRWRAAIAIVGICLLAILLPKPLFNTLVHKQQLTVAVVRPSQGDTGAPSPKVRAFGVAEMEVQAVGKRILERIRAAGIAGDFQVTQLWRLGEGKSSLAIFVVQAPVAAREFFGQPDAATALYVQESGGWTRHPANGKTLARGIEIWPPLNPAEALGDLSIADADGMELVARIEKL